MALLFIVIPTLHLIHVTFKETLHFLPVDRSGFGLYYGSCHNFDNALEFFNVHVGGAAVLVIMGVSGWEALKTLSGCRHNVHLWRRRLLCLLGTWWHKQNQSVWWHMYLYTICLCISVMSPDPASGYSVIRASTPSRRAQRSTKEPSLGVL